MMQTPPDTPPAEAHRFRAGNGKRLKVRLLDRRHVDSRTRAAKTFAAIAQGIANDLDPDQLSTIRKHLIEAFAGVAIVMHDINARLMSGEAIDLIEATQTATTLTRLATRIGCDRVPKIIEDGALADYDAELARLEAEDAADQGAEDTP
jgi:hypothetical protein